MSKENPGLKVFSNSFVFGKFIAIVCCDRMGPERQWLQEPRDS